MGVSLESAAELDRLEFPDVEPSSVKFGATGSESRSLESHPTQAFHLHHQEYGVLSGPGDVWSNDHLVASPGTRLVQ